MGEGWERVGREWERDGRGWESPRSVLRRGYQHLKSGLPYPLLGSPQHGRSGPALGGAHETSPGRRAFYPVKH